MTVFLIFYNDLLLRTSSSWGEEQKKRVWDHLLNTLCISYEAILQEQQELTLQDIKIQLFVLSKQKYVHSLKYVDSLIPTYLPQPVSLTPH